MMQKKSDAELRASRDTVRWVGRLSDNIIHVGPLSLGIDGILSWVPGIGELYSVAAGGFIIAQGARAGVPIQTLVGAGVLLGFRTIVSGVPIAGAAFSDIFTAHKWAAAMIVKAIDQQLGAPAGLRRGQPWTGTARAV